MTRAPIIKITKNQAGSFYVEISLPPELWMENKDEERVEIPDVSILPYSSHLNIGFGSQLKPKIIMAVSRGVSNVEDLMFGALNVEDFMKKTFGSLAETDWRVDCGKCDEAFMVVWNPDEEDIPLFVVCPHCHSVHDRREGAPGWKIHVVRRKGKPLENEKMGKPLKNSEYTSF